MIDEKNKEVCCGCGVCEQICPKQAITMCADDEGFLYPVVDMNKCIDCGLCEIRCAFRKAVSDSVHLEKKCKI